MKVATPNMLKNCLLTASLVCLGGLALSAQTKEDRDVVQLRDGKSQSVAIEAENWDTIVGKGSPPIPWDNVQGISYADAPEFNKAIEAFSAGNYAAATQQFEQLKEDPKLRKVFKQQIAFDSAYALAQDGKYDEAILGYQDVLKTYAKGRYHVRAVDGLAQCILAKKDMAAAVKAVDASIAEAVTEPGLAAALGLVKARLLDAQEKYIDF